MSLLSQDKVLGCKVQALDLAILWAGDNARRANNEE